MQYPSRFPYSEPFNLKEPCLHPQTLRPSAEFQVTPASSCLFNLSVCTRVQDYQVMTQTCRLKVITYIIHPCVLHMLSVCTVLFFLVTSRHPCVFAWRRPSVQASKCRLRFCCWRPVSLPPSTGDTCWS